MKNQNYLVAILSLLVIFLASTHAYAASSSSNFRIDEDFIGPGGQLDSSSSNYKLDSGASSLGNTGGGESSSANFNQQGGSTTTSDPSLSCALNTSNLNFGSLSTATTITGTAVFSVLNYTSYGYIVSIKGATPSNGSHNLNALSSPAASSVGTEQFGINLVSNSSPAVGSNPVQNPSGTFSFGQASTGYSTSNQFKYANGDTIANSVKSSGQTDYTISYIINAATTTPGGSYTGNQTIICTGTY